MAPALYTNEYGSLCVHDVAAFIAKCQSGHSLLLPQPTASAVCEEQTEEPTAVPLGSDALGEENDRGWCSALPHDAVPGPLVSHILNEWLSVTEMIVSQQHVMQHADGMKVLFRRAPSYRWTYTSPVEPPAPPQDIFLDALCHAPIQHADFSGNRQMADAEFIPIVARIAGTVKTISLFMCASLQIESVNFLVEKCTHLRELNMRGCSLTSQILELVRTRPDIAFSSHFDD